MPTLYHIPATPNKPKVSLLEALPPAELLREGKKAPTAKEINELLKPPSGGWEHVNVLVDNRLAHLFCDENGWSFELPPNLRASLLYANVMLRSLGREPYSLKHALGAKANGSRFIRFSDYKLMADRRLFILGDCLLWTGEWL